MESPGGETVRRSTRLSTMHIHILRYDTLVLSKGIHYDKRGILAGTFGRRDVEVWRGRARDASVARATALHEGTAEVGGGHVPGGRPGPEPGRPGGPAGAAPGGRAKRARPRVDEYLRSVGVTPTPEAQDAITRTLSLGEDEQLALPYEGPGGEPLRKGRRPRVRKGTEAAPAPAAGELSSSEAAEALAFRELGPLQRAFTDRDQISAIIPALVTREIPAFVIQGKVIETHLLPNFARLQIARGRAE